MIDFNGYITDEAEKFFIKNSRKMAVTIFLVIFLLLAPIFVLISVGTDYYELLIGYVAACSLTIATAFIPQSRKWKIAWMPKRIFTDEEYIVCQGNKYEEFHLIDDATRVIDYGAFYHICFPMGKKSDKFICQKSLLSSGTFEEFEALFEGKIERRTK